MKHPVGLEGMLQECIDLSLDLGRNSILLEQYEEVAA